MQECVCSTMQKCAQECVGGSVWQCGSGCSLCVSELTIVFSVCAGVCKGEYWCVEVARSSNF